MKPEDIKNLIKGLEPFLEQKIKEAHFTGIQTGGTQTSNLADEVLKKIEPTIKESMDKNFNGKMGRLDQKLTDHISSFDEFKEDIKTMFKDKEIRVSSLEKGKIQIWTAISVLLLLGGAIITLSIKAIDSKIEKGFQSPEVQKIIKTSIEQALLENATIYENK